MLSAPAAPPSSLSVDDGGCSVYGSPPPPWVAVGAEVPGAGAGNVADVGAVVGALWARSGSLLLKPAPVVCELLFE